MSYNLQLTPDAVKLNLQSLIGLVPLEQRWEVCRVLLELLHAEIAAIGACAPASERRCAIDSVELYEVQQLAAEADTFLSSLPELDDVPSSSVLRERAYEAWSRDFPAAAAREEASWRP